ASVDRVSSRRARRGDTRAVVDAHEAGDPQPACSTSRRGADEPGCGEGGTSPTRSREPPPLALAPERRQIDPEQGGGLLQGRGQADHPLHVGSFDVLERTLVSLEVASAHGHLCRTTAVRDAALRPYPSPQRDAHVPCERSNDGALPPSG